MLVNSRCTAGDGPTTRFKSAQSEPRRQLIEAMQRINFGRIEQLSIHDSEPILRSPAKEVITFKLKSELDARSELLAADFSLKQEVIALFDIFDSVRSGVIERIDIKHGLPFLAEITRALD